MGHDTDWDQHAEDWDQRDATRAYASAAFSSLQEIAGSRDVALAGAKVLDFGCGTGLLTEQLVSAGAAVHGVDTSPAMLDVLNRKARQYGWRSVHTSTELPTSTELFDLVVCSSVCSFLDDYPGAVEELVALLRPGGLFVQWDWERTGDDPGGLSKQEIGYALDRAGLLEVSVKVGFVVTIEDHTMSPLVGYGQRPLGPSTRSEQT